MTEHEHLDQEIHELNTRMALVERDLAVIAGMRKWIMTGVIAIILQAGGVLYTYGQLTEKVKTLGSSTLTQDVSSNRAVLADHSGEIQGVRTEQARIRERIDVLTDQGHPVDNKDLAKLSDRLLRIERKIFQ